MHIHVINIGYQNKCSLILILWFLDATYIGEKAWGLSWKEEGKFKYMYPSYWPIFISSLIHTYFSWYRTFPLFNQDHCRARILGRPTFIPHNLEDSDYESFTLVDAQVSVHLHSCVCVCVCVRVLIVPLPSIGVPKFNARMTRVTVRLTGMFAPLALIQCRYRQRMQLQPTVAMLSVRQTQWPLQSQMWVASHRTHLFASQ